MPTHHHPAAIHPAVLSWALSRAGATVADLAKAADTSEDVATEWLAGTKQPSFRQAKAAAKRVRVPFGYLFLQKPPPETLPIPDFRTVHGRPINTLSVDLRDSLYAVMRKQEWLSDYLRDSGSGPSPAVGRMRGMTDVDAIASDMRTVLELSSINDRPARADTFLRELIKKCDLLGISVLRSGVVGNDTHRPLDVGEFRGFSLSDPFAPFIFINSADASPAQVFTLIHELTHIWRGDTGIPAICSKLLAVSNGSAIRSQRRYSFRPRCSP